MNENADMDPQAASMAALQAAQLQGDLTNLINAIVKGIDERLAPYEVDAASYAVLAALFNGGPTEISGLRRMVPIDPGRMSRMVSALANRNLVRKIRLQSDQRVVRVELTKDGETVAPQLIERIENFYIGFMESVSEEEISTCIATIETLTSNAATAARNWEAEQSGSSPGPGTPPSRVRPTDAAREGSPRKAGRDESGPVIHVGNTSRRAQSGWATVRHVAAGSRPLELGDSLNTAAS